MKRRAGRRQLQRTSPGSHAAGGAPRRAAAKRSRSTARRPPPPRPRRAGTGAGIDRLIERQPWDMLTPHLLKAGVPVEPTRERLERYARLLVTWNRSVSNVMSRNDEQRIVERHIAESIEPASWLKAAPASRWLDFGSGAGLPAIPLAIAGVGRRWTLVESRRMKTLFIKKTLQELGLQEIEAIAGRLESMVSDESLLSSYDGFTSRATLALGPTLVLAASFVAPGGVAFLWKGSQREREMAADPRWQEGWDFDGLLGIGGGQSVVARFTRKG